ncbi:family 78 glycoside hydrolase catalytic domain [Mucilaginibacter sp. ZT4R22]|uniref:alpha-L-rhamnosidase n=1 Tax=Mucilaginibacter pankratovii TaxID=2772110 RepID=A0ABR7WLP5_9SPHI|nr:alpha-L-rhamnosidase [Mucilaginibacter pankratovii]MBD1363248.1 family 78 glycoside hydrolase catalytic domain [Mucilaginibacter pankratovii]
MRRIFTLVTVFTLVATFAQAQISVNKILCENRTNPIGLDNAQPRFTWELASAGHNVSQTAYQVRVSTHSDFRKIIWDSKKVASDSSVHVGYKGKALSSHTKYYWQVKVWDNTKKASAWSETGYWITSLFNANEWQAKWIGPGFKEDSLRASPMFRKTFSSTKKVASAVAFITAHGLYEAQINGRRVGDAYLTPGWTSYGKRLQYQAYDVTDLLTNGNNTIGVTLGSGWYRGTIGFANNSNRYGKDIALLMQMHITYTDGTSEVVLSDGSWKSSTGEITYSEIYNGETIDARKIKKGWALNGYNDTGWNGVQVADYGFKNLLATYNEPIRKHETFKALRVIKTKKNEHIVDFGQNLVGWVKIRLKGKKGQKVTISHAEVLDKDGNFYTDNLRSAKAQDNFILGGDDVEVFEPHFTFHGFQFIKVEGYNGDLNPDDFTAVTIYSDMAPTGTFSSSNALVNQLQHNIQWGQKGNFLDVPTDCPQRDERLGWTGDAQVFSRTASFNMNVDNFFSKWLKDITADQTEKGAVPFVIPNVLGKGAAGSAGWGEAATVIPWNMYVAYGDKQVLKDQYGSMKAWVDYMKNQAKDDLWNTGFHFGDWLFYSVNDDTDGTSAVTDKYLIAQCFYAYSTQLLINAAQVLGKTDDYEAYGKNLKRIKDAFMREYVTANGRMVSGTQTAYVLALNFDMLPEDLRPQAAARLVTNIKNYNNHLTTGFLGTPYLCHVLSRFGYTDEAYKLLLQDTYPSWLYPVKMGATTIWERWDGIKPDKTFETPTMNSFNHYSYGAIGDWMYRVMVGLDTYNDGPGYKHIKIMPHPGGGFTNASASLQTYYGTVSSAWAIADGQLNFDVEIPVNTTASVYIPAKDAANVMDSGKPLKNGKPYQPANSKENYIMVELGSGTYHFTAPIEVQKVAVK